MSWEVKTIRIWLDIWTWSSWISSRYITIEEWMSQPLYWQVTNHSMINLNFSWEWFNFEREIDDDESWRGKNRIRNRIFLFSLHLSSCSFDFSFFFRLLPFSVLFLFLFLFIMCQFSRFETHSRVNLLSQCYSPWTCLVIILLSLVNQK